MLNYAWHFSTSDVKTPVVETIFHLFISLKAKQYNTVVNDMKSTPNHATV